MHKAETVKANERAPLVRFLMLLVPFALTESFDVTGGGDNSNQCVGITGNAQNQIGLTQLDEFGNPFFFDRFGIFHNGSNDFEFDDTAADLTVTGTSTTSCDQQVDQAAAAG